jgi:hypothetical protein
MKQQEVFKKIGGIIKELNDQYEYLKTVEGQLNELELELFVANSHFLMDHLVILNKLNSQTVPVQKVAEKEPVVIEDKPVEKAAAPKEEKYFEPLVRSVAPEDKNEPEHAIVAESKTEIPEDEQPVPEIDLRSGSAEDSYSFQREEPETIRHELILDESEVWEDEDEQAEPIGEEIEIPPIPEKITTPPKKEEVKHVAEKHAARTAKDDEKKDVLTVNQKMSAQMHEKSGGLGEQLSVQTITDLKAAITLNDKLLYIKELFNGYNLAYSEAIDILNRFNSFDEADLFLKKNYVAKNQWESKPETTAKFFALLKRRYE